MYWHHWWALRKNTFEGQDCPEKKEGTAPIRDRRLKRTTQTIESVTVLASDKNLVTTPPQVMTLVSRSKSTGNAQTISSVNILKSAQANGSRFFSASVLPPEEGFYKHPNCFLSEGEMS